MSRLFLGDSITFGTGGIGSTFARQLDGVNAGVPGMQTARLILEFDVLVNPFLAPNQVVHLLLGVNDASAWVGLPAAEFRSNMEALADLTLADGRTLYVSPPYHIDLFPPSHAVNSRISDYGSELADLWANDSRFNKGAGLLLNPPSTIDGVHPDQAGHDHIANLLTAALP